MKTIRNFVWVVCTLFAAGNARGQSVGATTQVGIYSPSYTNTDGIEEEVTGKGFLSLGATYEIKLGNDGQLAVPFALTYSRFGSEQVFSETQTMQQDANAISLGGGIKYFMNDDDNTFRPFVGLLLSYEALVNSSYYFDAQQSGSLEWKSNLYAQVQVGCGIETGLNTRLDLYGIFNPGLLNRLDSEKYGTYRDQIIGLGVNIVFN